LAAANDEDERASRLQSLVRDEFLEREKAENKLADQLAKRAEYEFLFDPKVKREGGPVSRRLLDDRTRERLRTFRADQSIKPLPNTFDMAFSADRRWMQEIDLVGHNPFAFAYFVLFTGPSFLSHPSVTGVSRVVIGTAPNLVVGLPVPLGESEMPYGRRC
jgi:hypothetical protein